MDEIRFFMEESLVSVEPTASIREAAQRMRHHSISSILISESGNYTGILTDTNLTRKFAAKNMDQDHTLVSIIATNPIITLDADHLMEEAYECMRNKNIRHLGVTEKDEMIGILSIKDFANYYNFKFCQGKNKEDQIGHYMRERLETVPESTSIHKAARLMKENKIGSLLVTLNDDIAGIVTEEIFTRKVLGDNLHPETTLVSELMEKPTTIKATQSMDSALSCMHQNDARYLAVTEDNKIIGVISRKDLTIYYKHKFVTAQDIDE